MARLRAGVLISGRGSNMLSLVEASRDPSYPAGVACVLSNNPDAPGLAKAREMGIPAEVVDHTAFDSREAFEDAIHAKLMQYGVQMICLAGFMRVLTESFIAKWPDRILNIHPSLLPAFKGAHAHRDALAAGVKLSGCTVHIVRPEMDSGPILSQAAVPVLEADTEETLSARVLEAEHRIYPLALKFYLQGRVTVEGDRARVNVPGPIRGMLQNP